MKILFPLLAGVTYQKLPASDINQDARSFRNILLRVVSVPFPLHQRRFTFLKPASAAETVCGPDHSPPLAGSDAAHGQLKEPLNAERQCSTNESMQ